MSILFKVLLYSTASSFLHSTFCYNFLTALQFSSSYNNYSLDCVGRCRWSSHPDEPLLFVKYDGSLLNILDTEKKAFILKSPIEIESDGNYNRFFIFNLLLSFGR